MCKTQRAIPKLGESEFPQHGGIFWGPWHSLKKNRADLRRDTSEWDKGRLQQYQEQNLVGRPWGGAGAGLVGGCWGLKSLAHLVIFIPLWLVLWGWLTHPKLNFHGFGQVNFAGSRVGPEPGAVGSCCPGPPQRSLMCSPAQKWRTGRTSSCIGESDLSLRSWSRCWPKGTLADGLIMGI